MLNEEVRHGSFAKKAQTLSAISNSVGFMARESARAEWTLANCGKKERREPPAGDRESSLGVGKGMPVQSPIALCKKKHTNGTFVGWTGAKE